MSRPLIELDAKALRDLKRKLQARVKRQIASVRRLVANRSATELHLGAVDGEIRRRADAAKKKTLDALQLHRKSLVKSPEKKGRRVTAKRDGVAR